MSDDVSRGLRHTGGGGRAGSGFASEAGEEFARHGDDVAKGLEETDEQVGKKARQEFSEEASEQLAKHSDDVLKGFDDSDWGSNELGKLREKWNVPETDTIAVGKTDFPGLEGKVFEGGSPKVRKETGLPDSDDAFPDREIKSPRKNAFFTRHAEENVIQDFVRSVEELGTS